MEFIVADALKASTTKSDDDMLVGTANIKVIGCGGAGINMADWLYNKGVKGRDYRN